MTTSGVTRTRTSRMADIVRAVELATSRDVLVGVPSTGPTRDGSINNASLAYIHDNGAPEAGIPARPFMRPGIEAVQSEIKQRFTNIAMAAFEGRAAAVVAGLNAMGLRAANSIKLTINSNIPPPLAPATLAARRRRGVTRTNTLVDTAQMRNSITYVIRDT